MESHLLQMRGLKQASYNDIHDHTRSHLLQMRGLKQREFLFGLVIYVASFTDAWIETPQQGIAPLVGLSHLLQMRGLKQI